MADDLHPLPGEQPAAEDKSTPEEKPGSAAKQNLKRGIRATGKVIVSSVAAAVAAVVVAWAVFFAGPPGTGSRQVPAAGPSSSRSGTAAGAGLPMVTITAPRQNAVVGPCATVTFKSTGLPPAMAFALGISIPEHNAWHFTADNLVQIAPGVWSKTQSLGDASYGKGAPFIIGVYIMRKSELDALSDNETNPWDPSVPPGDATRLASVSVVRNTHDLSCP